MKASGRPTIFTVREFRRGPMATATRADTGLASGTAAAPTHSLPVAATKASGRPASGTVTAPTHSPPAVTTKANGGPTKSTALGSISTNPVRGLRRAGRPTAASGNKMVFGLLWVRARRPAGSNRFATNLNGAILFGSDLEETADPDTGWFTVIDSHPYPGTTVAIRGRFVFQIFGDLPGYLVVRNRFGISPRFLQVRNAICVLPVTLTLFPEINSGASV